MIDDGLDFAPRKRWQVLDTIREARRAPPPLRDMLAFTVIMAIVGFCAIAW